MSDLDTERFRAAEATKLEQFKAEQAQLLEDHKAELARQLEQEKEAVEHGRLLTQATIAFEHAAIRPLYLLNGGAVIAALTYAGNIGKLGGSRLDFGFLIGALMAWSAGLVAAFAVTAFGY
jgi:hypothetical protein